MNSIITTLFYQHDLILVGLAALVCAISAFAGIALIERARKAKGARASLWIAVAGLAVGSGVWSTHFIAMLAYMPGMAVGYLPVGTIGSLLIAIVMSGLGFAIAARGERRSDRLLGGIVTAIGIAGMHYVGMASLAVGGTVGWDFGLVGFSVVVASGFAAAALMLSAIKSSMRIRIGAATLLTLSIVSLHFTGMGAVDLSNCYAIVAANELNTGWVAAGVALGSVLILGSALFALLLDTKDAQRRALETQRLNSLADAAVEGLVIIRDDRIEGANSSFAKMIGLERETLTGLRLDGFVDMAAVSLARLTPGQFCQTELLTPDGNTIAVELVSREAELENGLTEVLAVRDIRERLKDAERIAEAKRNLELSLAHMSQGLALFGRDERIVVANRRLKEILGIPTNLSITGLGLHDLAKFLVTDEYPNPEDLDEIYAIHKNLIAGDQNGEIIQEFPGTKSIRIVHRSAVDGAWVSTFEDISERKRSEQQIQFMAHHDGLTGLPNRGSFSGHLQSAIDRAGESARVAVLGIDLDRFKEVNDQLGHQTGDMVLKLYAARIAQDLQDGEFVSRFGGDEFAAFKVFHTDAELYGFIQRLEGAIKERFSIERNEVFIGASIGVAVYPTDASSAEKLVSNADMAMYRAKQNLTERVCFYESEMDDAARDRRLMARDLWDAVERAQLSLRFQVQKSVQSGTTTGYEALLRWEHPERGMVSPVDFIPVAEECGAILPIGEWVLQKACMEATTWDDSVKLAVNISPVQLGSVDLIEVVRNALATSGLSPNRLELEVTESAIIADKARALHMLTQIKELGVTIAIDDFGTGYSSLETLRAFPFDKIKLDRSFMSEVETSKQAKAVIRAILALGRGLDVPVLAEGVETGEQLVFLQSEGCDEAQGYFLGRPEILARQSKRLATG